jgi:hypothetical protein
MNPNNAIQKSGNSTMVRIRKSFIRGRLASPILIETQPDVVHILAACVVLSGGLARAFAFGHNMTIHCQTRIQQDGEL